jgi:uncharacterized protein (DUF488 family)
MLTVGHSNRSAEDFVALLRAHGVDLLVDVRRLPKSKFNPQFHVDSLPGTLRQAGIGYLHMPELGGLRHSQPDSKNTGWKNSTFRGYADYMQTEAFQTALDDLQRLEAGSRVAIMCAEAVPWRCHRSLIADALTARGELVEHIASASRRSPHEMTKFAHVEGREVTYPGENMELF